MSNGFGFRGMVLALAMGCGAMCDAGPAYAEVALLNEDMFVVRHTGTVGAEADATWDALLSPSEWWSGAHSFSGDAANFILDPRAGGCFCEILPADEGRSEAGSVKHLEVLFVDPGKAMRLAGALGPLQSEPVRGVLTITLKPVENGTRILFEYAVGGPSRYDQDTIAPAVDKVIGEQLERLVRLLGEAGSQIDARTIPRFEPEASAPARDVEADEVGTASGPAADQTGFGEETRAVPAIEDVGPEATEQDGGESSEAVREGQNMLDGIGADFLSR